MDTNTTPARRTIVMGRITYINMDPVYYDLKDGQYPDWIRMIDDVPSVLNGMLAHNELDISPVSAVAYARHADRWRVLPNLSIASRGPVMSVILVSKRPIDQLDGQKVLLTEESATAADLVRLIFKRRSVAPRLQRGKVKTAADVPAEAQAALVIGDAALREPWGDHFEYVFDLGTLWWEMTGLPFVYALWVVRGALADRRPDTVAAVVDLFRKSKTNGYAHETEIVDAASQKLDLSRDTCRKYYEHLVCDLGPEEIQGAETFFRQLHENGILEHPARLSFFREN